MVLLQKTPLYVWKIIAHYLHTMILIDQLFFLDWTHKSVFTWHRGQNGMRTSLRGVATTKKGLRKVACCAKRSIVANSILPKVILFFQVWTTKDNAIHTFMIFFFKSSHIRHNAHPKVHNISNLCWIPEKNSTFLTLQVHTTNKEDI